MAVTIAGFTFDFGGSGDTCTVKWFADSPFLDPDGVYHPGGGEPLKTVACTVASNIATMSTFTLPATWDEASGARSSVTAYVYDSTGRKIGNPLVSDFRIPSLPSTTTWGALLTYNTNAASIRDTSTYTKTQTDYQIEQGLQVGNPATDEALGRVFLSKPAVDPARPEVVGTNDLATILGPGIVQFAADGVSSSSRAVRADDSRLVGSAITTITTAALAVLSAATAALRYVTDGIRGVYRMTNAGLWKLLLGHIDVCDYGAKGDGRELAGGAMTSGSAILTVTTGLTAADVGKVVVVPGAGATGADLVTTLQSFTSASQATLAVAASTTVAGKVVAVATDDTAALQAALTACGSVSGGIVFAPAGFYAYSSLTVASNYVRLKGCGWATRFAKYTAAGDGLTFSNGLSGITLSEDGTYLTGCEASNLRFEPMVTRTSGAEIVAYRFNKLVLNDLTINDAYQGVQIGRASDLAITAYIDRLRIYQAFIGLKAVNAIELYGHEWAVNQHNSTANSVGVWLSGGCEGFDLIDVDAVNSVPAEGGTVGANSYSLLIRNDAGTSTPARFNKFTSCFWDGGSTGARLEDGVSNSLVNCWYHGWTELGLAILGTAEHTTVMGGESVRCGWHGVYVSTTGAGTVINGLKSYNSGTVIGASNGFEVVTGVTDLTLTNCFGGTVASVTPNGSQDYGVSLQAGVTGVKVLDSKLLGNAGGAYNILATSETNLFQNNTTEFGVGDSVRSYRSTNQAIPNNTVTAISFDTDTSDPNSMHDTALNPDKFVALTPGFFSAKSTVQIAASGTGRRQLAAVRYNSDGSGAVAVDVATEESPAAGAATILNLSGLEFYMSYGQYVRFEVLQTSGGSLDVETAGIYSPAAAVVKVR